MRYLTNERHRSKSEDISITKLICPTAATILGSRLFGLSPLHSHLCYFHLLVFLLSCYTSYQELGFALICSSFSCRPPCTSSQEMVWFDITRCAGARGSGVSLHCRRQYQAWALGRASVEELEVTFGRFTLTEAFEEGTHFWGGFLLPDCCQDSVLRSVMLAASFDFFFTFSVF